MAQIFLLTEITSFGWLCCSTFDKNTFFLFLDSDPPSYLIQIFCNFNKKFSFQYGNRWTSSSRLKHVRVYCCLCLEDTEVQDLLPGFCLFTNISGEACFFLYNLSFNFTIRITVCIAWRNKSLKAFFRPCCPTDTYGQFSHSLYKFLLIIVSFILDFHLIFMKAMS